MLHGSRTLALLHSLPMGQPEQRFKANDDRKTFGDMSERITGRLENRRAQNWYVSLNRRRLLTERSSIVVKNNSVVSSSVN